MNKHLRALELDKILALLAEKTSSPASYEAALALRPHNDYRDVTAAMGRTAAISSLTTRYGTPGLGGIRDMGAEIRRAQVGSRMSIPELLAVGRVLRVIRDILVWRRQQEGAVPEVDHLFEALSPDKGLEEDIGRAILNEEELADQASPALADIRRNIRRTQQNIRDQLDQILRSPQYAKVLQENLITMRDGRFVVPVRAEMKGELRGMIHDTSASGATVFVEPMAVVEANNQIRMLEHQERQEVDRILLELSGRVGAQAQALADSFAALVELDLLFAKSRLADAMKATVPEIRQDLVVLFHKARHPLIPRDRVVPVDLELGRDFDTLVITGPNTGGKTVALKTLGLLCLMAACGLMLPVASGSCVPVFRVVLADIGDEQSIEQSLSTFSGHITNIISILKEADDRCLVLTDELGAGTDPVEGAALAVAILEAFRAKGVRMAATTHYAEIKHYALTTPGVENGSCEFDVETLSPTYRLLIGVPGRSNAFAISQRLGLGEEVILRARDLVSTENIRFEDVVDRLESTRQDLEKERAATAQALGEADALRRQMQQERERLEHQAARALEQARQQAQTLVERVRSQTDQLLGELEDLKKDKDKENFSQRVGQLRGSYKSRIGKLRDMADPVREAGAGDGYRLPRKLKAGDRVRLASLNLEGTVLSGPDGGGSYTIQAGIMKTVVKEGDLRLVDGPKVTLGGKALAPPRRSGAAPTAPRVEKAPRTPESTLDIRGMASDEGVMELDRFLDQALMSGLSVLTIIHGKGTGVLRRAIHDRLRQHRHVKSFRPGVYGEGEAGVTIVQL